MAKKKPAKKSAKKSTKKKISAKKGASKSRSTACKTINVCGNRRKLCFKKVGKNVRIVSNQPA